MKTTSNNNYLYGSNADFIEELYDLYLKDPGSVDPSWHSFFKELNEEKSEVEKSFNSPHWTSKKNKIIGYEEPVKSTDTKPSKQNSVHKHKLELQMAVANIIDAYRKYGHLHVQLDPLNITTPSEHPELDYKNYGITEEDLNETADAFGKKDIKIRDLLTLLKTVYSSRVAVEFSYIDNTEEKLWLSEQLEKNFGIISFSAEQKEKILKSLIEADTFENYLNTKFPGAKRFSIEGGESTITSIEQIIEESAASGIKEIIIGMAHRGRLNILTKIMKKPYHAMFSEFKGGLSFPDELNLPGDVKYHMGSSADVNINDQNIHLSLTPNPSHLEVVNSVVLGRARAKQDLLADTNRENVLSLLIHGDAAYAGQGSVMESLALSYLDAYTVGGTVHIVINNQIGFTANPKDSRSSRYCTDIAKMINAPVFHINGDDPEAIAFASKIAIDYRNKFKKDIFIDIVCYRKYGHNEGDEPFFTQPIMYSKIKTHPNVAEIYKNKLMNDGTINQEFFVNYQNDFKKYLDEEFKLSESYKPKKADWLKGTWEGFSSSRSITKETGVSKDKLKELGTKLYSIPENFNANSKISRLFKGRKDIIDTGKGLDWGVGEGLAYATLLDEGIHIRMTGEDVQRGTFSHRHAVITDQQNEQHYIALNHLKPKQNAAIEIYNSNLSEFGVLAFEYGYSYTSPKSLVIWEAQFGDFVNGAQVIIDQYIASGEAKWLRMSGLVLLLPHGYEGQGPEHSSGRIERFLQLCAEDNMVVANCSTPASFFHIIRRQMHRNFRKPLIIMTPKSLLRHKLAISDLEEISTGTRFQPVLKEKDSLASDSDIKKLIICSGKVYYDLYEKRQNLSNKNIAIIRVEELYPFPAEKLLEQIKRYPNAKIIWCQEEHKNMGAYHYIAPLLEQLLTDASHKYKQLEYIGREESATPAAGYLKLHNKELNQFLNEAFDIKN